MEILLGIEMKAYLYQQLYPAMDTIWYNQPTWVSAQPTSICSAICTVLAPSTETCVLCHFFSNRKRSILKACLNLLHFNVVFQFLFCYIDKWPKETLSKHYPLQRHNYKLGGTSNLSNNKQKTVKITWLRKGGPMPVELAFPRLPYRPSSI